MSTLKESSTGPTPAAPKEVMYRSEVKVSSTDGPMRLVDLPAETEPMVIGSHGALAEHFGYPLTGPTVHATTIDYFIGSLAGCLSGVLAGALRARGIPVSHGDLVTEAVGEVVPDEHGVVFVDAVKVRHKLRLADRDKAEVAERAHAAHARACPMHRTIRDAVPVTTTLELVS
jgi:uncharacterized OsmC-like protein